MEVFLPKIYNISCNPGPLDELINIFLKGIPKDENLIFLINIKLSISFFKLSICQFVILFIKGLKF